MAPTTALIELPSVDEFRSLLLEDEPYAKSVDSRMEDRPAVLDCCEFSGSVNCSSCASCHTA